MAYTYDIATSKKDNRANICLFSSHMILVIVDLFISTFLVAYIYQYCSSTTEYIFAVGQFYIANYLTNILLIWLISYIVERTNRVWMYRISLVIELAVVLLCVFKGEQIAMLAWLGGLMRGVFESFYYSSYNTLKHEMVSRSSMKTFTVLLQVIQRIINIVVPIALGALISASTYSTIAIYVAVICVIQIAVSFGIKSHKPEGSKFRLVEYNKKLAKNPVAKKVMRYIYFGCVLYGLNTCVGVLLNICIMFQYGSPLSLGAITSIISVVTMVVILAVNRFTKQGKRSVVFVLAAIIQVLGTILFVAMPRKETLIVYNVTYGIAHVIQSAIFDMYRNANLKEFGFYGEITEHQMLCETLFNISRIFSFGMIMLVGAFGNMISFYVLLVLFSLPIASLLIYLLVYEKKYLNINLLEKNQNSDIITNETNLQTINGENNEHN